MRDELTPQQRLANIVAEETDGGRRVVRFFVKVAEGELDREGFKPNHRMDAAKELVKVGLTEFDDYIRSGQTAATRRAPRTRRPAPDPETEQARQELADYARELTDDGRTVIRLYADVVDGLREDEGFKPHHRIAAGRELLKRGFDYECAHAQTSDDTQSASEARPHASELETGESDNPEHPIHPENPASDEEPVDLVAMAKEIVANLDPSEFEDEPPTDRKPNTTMWDIIEAQPRPVITEEHARIGAAKFHEQMERWRAWRDSDVKIPDPPEGLTRYDDR